MGRCIWSANARGPKYKIILLEKYLIFIFINFIVFSFSLSYSSLAQETNISPPLTLEDCLNLALQNNPSFLAYHQQYEASLARINIAKAFPQPELNFDYDLLPKPFSLRQSAETYFGVSQLIEFPGRRRWRAQASSLEAEEFRSDLENLKLDLVFQVKEAFYQLLLFEEEFKYAQQNLELARQFLEITEFKFSAGEISQSEVLRAKVEAAKAENTFKEAETRISLARARLNTLLGRKPDSVLEVRGELKNPFLQISLSEAKEKALLFRPEIKRIDFSLAKAEVQKKQVLLSYFPDFLVGLSKHRLEREKYWDFTLSLRVPLFFWQPVRGELAEAEALRKAINQEKISWLNQIFLEVEEAYREAKLAEDRIRVFEVNILPQAEQFYDMFTLRYEEGEISGLELIEARRTLMEARIDYAQTLYKHALSLAALEKALGLHPGGLK